MGESQAEEWGGPEHPQLWGSGGQGPRGWSCSTVRLGAGMRQELSLTAWWQPCCGPSHCPVAPWAQAAGRDRDRVLWHQGCGLPFTRPGGWAEGDG